VSGADDAGENSVSGARAEWAGRGRQQ